MKLSNLFAVLFLITVLSTTWTAYALGLPESGECGPNAYWSYDEESKSLVISGEGVISGKYVTTYDAGGAIGFSDSEQPWSHISRFVGEYDTVIINNGITTIGNGSFSLDDSIKFVRLPDSLESIGDKAFYSCCELVRVDIPKSVEVISDTAFAFSKSIEGFCVDESNAVYAHDDEGVLYDKDFLGLIQYPLGNKNKRYDVPESVSTISEYAFAGSEYLEVISIPESVINIGANAFVNCTNLTEIYYYGTKTDWESAIMASVHIPEGVKVHFLDKSDADKIFVNEILPIALPTVLVIIVVVILGVAYSKKKRKQQSVN